jgi:hypothetical protein
VTFTNVTPIPIATSQLSVSGDQSDFTTTTDCGNTLDYGDTCSVYVVFAPVASGLRTATINFSNSSHAFSNASVMGTGVSAGLIGLSTSSINFGIARISTVASANLVISNSGGSPISLSELRISGPEASEFSFSYNCGGIQISPGNGTCVLSMQFAPIGLGTRSATLIIGDFSGSSQQVALSGFGELFEDLFKSVWASWYPPKEPQKFRVFSEPDKDRIQSTTYSLILSPYLGTTNTDNRISNVEGLNTKRMQRPGGQSSNVGRAKTALAKKKVYPDPIRSPQIH